MKCPNCGSPLKRANTISSAPSEFWLECTKCNALINTYVPQDHQMETHRDEHLYVMNAGGYGSGKTLTSRQEVYRHVLTTPNANVLIGAKVTAQYEQTIKRDIEQDLPALLVKYINVQKSYIDLVNGARIMFRPFDDPEKLRSLNLSFFLMVEASEVSADTFHQLKTRLRNPAAFNAEHDWRRGLIETNPDAGWVRSDVVLNAESIKIHGSVIEEYPPSLTPDPNISVHITSTDANVHLPPNFIQELSINKPQWWVSKFIFGSFMYAEGLVYPSATRNVVEEFAIPKNWKRLVAADYGLADKFSYLGAAVDPKDGIVYIYKNATTTNKNIEELAKMYFSFTEDIPSGGLLTTPLMDPKSGAKRDYNKKTLYDHFMDYGIYFQPGHIQLDARIYRVNTYFESGRLKVMDNCTELTTELQSYKFPERTLTSKVHSDKPVDKDNHSINPLEWICMYLPADPRKLQHGAFHASFFDSKTQVANRMWQLDDSTPQGAPDDPMFFSLM